MRPIYTVNDVLYEVWPVDGWSRKIITRHCSDQNILYKLSPTTMGEPALKFEADDYTKLVRELNEGKISK